jgi:hypothetical protein
MTRVDAYLFKNSLKMILKLLDAPTLDDATKARIKAEIDVMIQVLDRSSLK